MPRRIEIHWYLHENSLISTNIHQYPRLVPWIHECYGFEFRFVHVTTLSRKMVPSTGWRCQGAILGSKEQATSEALKAAALWYLELCCLLQRMWTQNCIAVLDLVVLVGDSSCCWNCLLSAPSSSWFLVLLWHAQGVKSSYYHVATILWNIFMRRQICPRSCSKRVDTKTQKHAHQMVESPFSCKQSTSPIRKKHTILLSGTLENHTTALVSS